MFFVFHSVTPKGSTVSRFRVSSDDPDRADRDSEQLVLTFLKPFGNHNGGSIKFGPDGHLYIAVGDGGAGNDPQENAQNLEVFQGKILRIDVDQRDAGKMYAIPKDNPFVGKSDRTSITGGYVYRGKRLPTLEGAYLYADFMSGNIWALNWNGTKVTSNPGGPGRAGGDLIDFRSHLSLAEAFPPKKDGKAGDPGSWNLLHRMSTREQKEPKRQMPPIATYEVDQEGVGIIGKWLEQEHGSQ